VSVFQQITRDITPVHLPDVIDTGVQSCSETGEVWGWVRLHGRSTDDVPVRTLHRMTDRDARDLAGLIPVGKDFHIKIQFSHYDGDSYMGERWDDDLTDGQKAHLGICADRIDAYRLPDRVVLVGVRFDEQAQHGDRQGLAAKLSQRLSSSRKPTKDGEAALRAAASAVHSWIDDMESSGLNAKAATKTEIAWSLARDVQATEPEWLPGDEDFVGPGQVARLAPSRVVPADDHTLILSPDGTERFIRILVPTTGAAGGFPTEGLELPGGEWLRDLFIAASEQDKGAPPVEVSIRGTNLSRSDAARRIQAAMNTAREQMEEAEGVGSIAPQLVREVLANAQARIADISGGRCDMVEDTPTWLVEAKDLRTLRKRCKQVIHHYKGMGIELYEPTGFQDLLFRQFLIGDRIRVREFTQLRPWTTLAGGWGQGGSVVGSTDPKAMFLGVNIGSTPRPFQLRVTEASQEGKAGTMAAVGTSGAGKSTAVCLTCLMEAVWGAWVLLTDFKGDLAGVPDAARKFGVRVTEISTNTVAAGSLCPFRYVPNVKDAQSLAIDFVLALLKGKPTGQQEAMVRRAAITVAARPNKRDRSCFAVIQELRSTRGPNGEATPTSELGDDLADLADDPLARPVVGDPANLAQTLPKGPGLVYMRFSDLRWPGSESNREDWSAGSRLSVMLVQAGFAYATYMAAQVKGIPKLVALTELHLLTKYDFGRDFVGNLAKLGRAQDVAQILDTQEGAEMTRINGLLDQITSVLAFHVNREEEARAQAQLMGMEADESFIDAQTAPVVKDHRDCLVLDRDRQLGRVQFDYLTGEIKRLLNTTPDRHAPVIEDEAEEAVA